MQIVFVVLTSMGFFMAGVFVGLMRRRYGKE